MYWLYLNVNEGSINHRNQIKLYYIRSSCSIKKLKILKQIPYHILLIFNGKIIRGGGASCYRWTYWYIINKSLTRAYFDVRVLGGDSQILAAAAARKTSTRTDEPKNLINKIDLRVSKVIFVGRIWSHIIIIFLLFFSDTYNNVEIKFIVLPRCNW